MSHISTHILDTSRGRPAAGVAVTLESCNPDGTWQVIAQSTTDADGRVANLIKPNIQLAGGDYQLRFATGEYFRLQGISVFYPEVAIQVHLEQAGRYHLPLLLSPFGYSTYRGS